MGMRGGMPKNMASKGGPAKKIRCVKGGSPKKFAFKFSSDSICNNANFSARMPKDSVSKLLEIQIFLGEHIPGPPNFIIHSTATLPTNYFVTKRSQGNVNLFWPLLVQFLND